MARTNDSVFYRRNQQIQDVIDGQNFKQALQLIEKRMKKGEVTRFLRAWKAQILLCLSDEPSRQRGATETLKLCDEESETTDLETLEILFESLEKIKKVKGFQVDDETKTKLWEKAAKTSPKDLDIQKRWLYSALDTSDWKSAQKAAMSLQKNFPKKRSYYFWAIFMSYMVSVDEKSSETDKKLFGTLASRMISKAGADVPTDPAQLLSHPRAIQNAEEVRLLLKILETQRQHGEVVRILDSENLGVNSQIVRGDRTFHGLMVDNLLLADNMWDRAFSYVQSLYTVPDDEDGQKKLLELDEWKIWNLLHQSALRSEDDSGIITKALDLAEKFLEFAPKSRNAALARIMLVSCAIDKGQLTTDDWFPACKQYVDQHIHKQYAFQDILKATSHSKDKMRALLDYIQNHKQENKIFVPQINALKVEYCLCISSPDTVSKKVIEDYVTRCLKLYHTTLQTDSTEKDSSATESEPSDDLCLLAAMALLRTASTAEAEAHVSDTSLIRAAGILEHLLQSSPLHYPALLYLVRIYSLLGAGSLAMSTFSKLSIKNMQYETVAHNFFTRIGSIHPHTTPPIEGAEYKDFHPQSALVQGLRFYRNSDVSTSRYRDNGLNLGTYVAAAEIVQLGKSLTNSFCRRMYALDLRRAQRLVGGDPTSMWDEIARNRSPVEDLRNSSVYMDCEFAGKPAFEDRLRVGPKPNVNWLAAAQTTDQLFSVLKRIAIQSPLIPELDLPAHDAYSTNDVETDQTDMEKEAANINLELLRVATFMAGSKASTSEQVDSALAQVENWLNSKKADLTLNGEKISPLITRTALYLQPTVPAGPTWRYLHSVFTILESLKAVSQLVSLASSKSPKTVDISKERVEKLSNLTPVIFELVRSNTRALKTQISASGVLGSLVNCLVNGEESDRYGQDLKETLEAGFDMSKLEIFCGELMESWEVALDGVMGVKL